MTLKADIQNITPGALLELFVVDLAPMGQSAVFRFYDGTDINYGNITFQGYDFAPWPIKASGFSKSSGGVFPRPKLSLANATGYVSGLVRSYEDLVGAKVQRLRTLGQYLDNGETPDPTAVAIDTFFINRREGETRSFIVFELASSIDIANKRLPGRVMIANTCTWQYKSSECEWPGTNPNRWYDRNGVQVFTQASDVCGKRLTDCKLRFGQNAELPYGGFPGMGRLG